MTTITNLKRPLRALLVDDSEDDVALLVRALRAGGFDVVYRQVYTAEDVEQALAEPWQVVISDWSMPDFNGLDAFRIVRRCDPDMPFIIVSGTIGEEVAVDALKAGVQDFMSKGKFARLVPTIDRELREAESRRRQRNADAELAAQRREVERSERLLRDVLHTVPDGVIVTDREATLLLWNDEAERILGFTSADRPAGAWRDRFTPSITDMKTPVRPQQRVVTRILAGAAIDRETYYITRTDATEGAWISVSGRPLFDEGAIRGALMILRDVTHERAANEQLLVSDRMASVGMLAAGVAHEINNPLAAVIANIELVMGHIDADRPPTEIELEESTEMLGDALDGANRVRQIVRDLRVFSRHEEPASGTVDIHQTLDSTLRMARNEIRHRATLVKDYGTIPTVRGSESRLGQVFLNLLVNAAQAMPDGSASSNTITIRTSTDELGNVVIDIVDTGIGMPPETQRRLFTPFFTTKRQGEGTGLGLAISHRIVTQLGGSIEVESEPGKGTTFRVRLPQAERVAAAGTVTTTSSPSLTPKRARILIVDDDEMVATVARRILSVEHDVETTNEGSHVLARLRAGERFDLILCDLMMPHMTGMELYDRLLQDHPDEAARVVFLTGGAFTNGADAFLDRVSHRTLEKPFDAMQLRGLVNKYLE